MSDTPIVVIQGARQVGKSTLAQMVTQDRDALVVTMDDPPSLTMAKDDPIGAVSLYPQGLLVVDEAQRAPELILPIKANVDRDRRPGRFLLTGSADLLKVKGVADSLAGRAQTVEMMPLSQGELAGRTKPEDFVAWLLVGAEGRDFPSLDPQAVLRGGFPEVRNRSANRLRPWFDSYAGRLSDHDARGVANGGYADHLLGMLRFLAAHGQAELVKSH
ncbi:MAG: AAA family ATPase, partial [Micrococcales bacterium]|nr:AAA family ATPase [Micrococcales bacterium]